MAKIMVVDDDAHIRQLVRLYLEDEGMEVVEKSNGEEAWDEEALPSVDLFVLDVMMPNMDGWEMCRKLRKQGNKPVLMLTAKSEPSDKIKGFQLGTDDYLVKPFDPMELVMRVKALLKRYRISISQEIQLGGIVIDKSSYTVLFKKGEDMVTLPLKEFELLYLLASYPGRLFTRNMLIEHIWGYRYEGDSRTVDTHIKRLRDRFAGYSHQFRIITLRGLGYRLEIVHD
ncbi:response regulator transcription factor [Cohnella sp. REN36]|uniref:response regulator transcription factor n=1 Tax=Cohnella sp. REN36 TaxID=2887347 RepID=UPI001D1554E3|nr:response regulator transcription factor [Cohnella sp. REN36]MCC3372728.1 response regulator transcription factor [Cohnella sp. REN36]